MQQGSSGHGATDEIYREFRRTAASDPRAAREQLLQMLSTDSAHLPRFLELMKPPSEGRLRQLVANTARALREDKPLRDRLIPHLLRWQRFESDEFAKPAINAALQGLDLAVYADDSRNAEALTGDALRGTPLFSEEAIEIYRWVAGRLCHRVRNHLELPSAYLESALHTAMAVGDQTIRVNLTQSLVQAQQAFRKIARVVDFNIDDDHFIWHHVPIVSWLRRMTNSYRSMHGEMRLEFTGDVNEPGPGVWATDLLLEVAFWNLWRNAAQEAGGECLITVGVSIKNGKVYLLLIDNGPGFRAELVEGAFQVSISTRGEDRGRGLLEVADAIRTLQGTARIVPVDGKYRIELSLPLAKAPEEMQ